MTTASKKRQMRPLFQKNRLSSWSRPQFSPIFHWDGPFALRGFLSPRGALCVEGADGEHPAQSLRRLWESAAHGQGQLGLHGGCQNLPAPQPCAMGLPRRWEGTRCPASGLISVGGESGGRAAGPPREETEAENLSEPLECRGCKSLLCPWRSKSPSPL